MSSITKSFKSFLYILAALSFFLAFCSGVAAAVYLVDGHYDALIAALAFMLFTGSIGTNLLYGRKFVGLDIEHAKNQNPIKLAVVFGVIQFFALIIYGAAYNTATLQVASTTLCIISAVMSAIVLVFAALQFQNFDPAELDIRNEAEAEKPKRGARLADDGEYVEYVTTEDGIQIVGGQVGKRPDGKTEYKPGNSARA